MVLDVGGNEGKYTVRILDREYPVEGDIPVERLKKIELYLDTKFRDLLESAPMVPFGRLAILACLNITNELFEQNTVYKNRLADYEQKINVIMSLMNRNI